MSPHNPGSMMPRSLAHDASAVVILGFYGGQVCPFVESLGLGAWMLELAILFVIFSAIRQAVSGRFIDGLPAAKRPAGQFWLELGQFVLIGIAIILVDSLLYGFPVGSGLKMLLGTTALGFFKAMDMGLARERTLPAELASEGHEMDVERNFFPITQKFAIFTTVTTVTVAGVLILVIFKDLSWMMNTKTIDPDQAKLAVVKEILFVAAILLAHIFNLILSYSHNLKLMVDNENQALMAVANGDLLTYVAVGTNDEFGIMARYTNLMIHRLDESRRRLEQAQRRLVDVERLRAIGEFASTIAHEIRSPLNVVQMTLEYFDKQELAPGGRKRLDLASGEVARLGGLMNEILLYAKPQNLKLERLDVVQATNDWMDTFKTLPVAQDRRIELHVFEQELWIEADADKLKQVMINLVSNAFEAIPEGDAVRVKLAKGREDCLIEVHNGGEPIPPERLQRIMEPFFTTKPGGTGLGLPIVKRIMEAHGGTFSITSSEEEGTGAVLSLPQGGPGTTS